LKDQAEFDRWRKEQQEKDEVLRVERVMKVKIEMEMAREQAIIQKEKRQEDNWEQVQLQKQAWLKM
jgi:hypothetical protein